MPSCKSKLLDRINRRFPTIVTRIRLENLDLSFTRIANPDLVLDDAVAEEDRRQNSPDPSQSSPARIPYWAEVWESALGLGQLLARTLSGSPNILDLGCGMGLAGAAAAAASPNCRVLMADIEPTALLLARLNTWPWKDRIRVRRTNWQTDRLNQRFDLILGADILYEVAQWEPLHNFWLAHLSPGGTILLGEPGRQTGDSFTPWAAARGWQVEQSLESIPVLPRPVRIFHLTLPTKTPTVTLR